MREKRAWLPLSVHVRKITSMTVIHLDFVHVHNISNVHMYSDVMFACSAMDAQFDSAFSLAISEALNCLRCPELILKTEQRVVVEDFLELFTVAQKQMVVKHFDREDLLQLQRTEVMA